MRIVTWNINGLNARLDFLLRYLETESPDLVGLQELKMVDDAVPHLPFESLGYEVHTHGQKAWNGVAVLSKLPVDVVTSGLPGQDGFGSRLLSVEGPFGRFTTVYCPNGKTLEHSDYGRKLDWYDSLLEYLKTVEGEHVIGGDFNICPSALDTYGGERHEGRIFHTKEERARIRAIEELGYTDLFRSLHSEDPGFSWWDYRGGSFHRGHGLRIDLLFATQGVSDRTHGCGVERDWRKKLDGLTASDHAPVWCDVHGEFDELTGIGR